MSKLISSLVLLTVGLLPILVSATDCSTIPPHLWCSHKDIISSCNLTDLCSKFINSTLNKPIRLKVLIESLCPDTENWIINHLYPQVYKNFADFVTVEFVPYGNAKVQNNKTICQHGDEECRINRYEGCAIDAMSYQNLYVPFIYCLENQLKNKTPFDKVSQKCIRTLGVGQDLQKLIQDCDVSSHGEELQKKAANETMSVWPEKHTNIPWVVFNEISLSTAQHFLYEIPSLICQWYNGEKVIPYCVSKQKALRRSSTPRF